MYHPSRINEQKHYFFFNYQILLQVPQTFALKCDTYNTVNKGKKTSKNTPKYLSMWEYREAHYTLRRGAYVVVQTTNVLYESGRPRDIYLVHSFINKTSFPNVTPNALAPKSGSAKRIMRALMGKNATISLEVLPLTRLINGNTEGC